MPVIQLKQINDVKLGKHPAKEVVGTKLQDNTTWKKAFFANNKELRDKLADFEMGDVVNVVLEKKGEYYNITDFQEVDDADIEKATTAPAKAAPAEQRGGYVRATPVGGTRGDDTNRSAAIYLARDILNLSPAAVSNMTPAELTEFAIFLASEYVYPYIKDGTVPPKQAPAKPKKEKAKVDPLEPPAVE